MFNEAKVIWCFLVCFSESESDLWFETCPEMNNFFVVFLSTSVILWVSRRMCRKVYVVSQMFMVVYLAVGRAGENFHCIRPRKTNLLTVLVGTVTL